MNFKNLTPKAKLKIKKIYTEDYFLIHLVLYLLTYLFTYVRK
jgi:hypothetical protein